MHSRVEQFEATHQIEELDFEASPQCKASWCHWVLHDSLAFAHRQGPQRALAARAAPVRRVALTVLPLDQEDAEEEQVWDDDGRVFL